MAIDPKNMKVTFAPGCFDNFEGTQEELDALIAEIQQKVADGTFFDNAVPIEEVPEMVELLQQLGDELDIEIFEDDIDSDLNKTRRLQ